MASDRNTRVQIGGGKGGTVLLITGTLFLGYLYFTNRLQSVYEAIKKPNTIGNPSLSLVPGNSSGTPSLPPLNPIYPQGSIIPGYPKSFTLTFPSNYGAPPVSIQASDPATCFALIERATLQATGSQALADMYVRQYCA